MPPVFSEPIQVERLDIAIFDLPSSLIGAKLVQLSDLHYDGTRLSPEVMEQAIRACNQEQADLILITGDFITDRPEPIPALAANLGKLKSKYGVYGCLGNHDSKAVVQQELCDLLLEVGVKILVNEIAYPLGSELALVGLADFWSSNFKPKAVFENVEKEIPRIVLSHNPDTAKVLAKYRVDLQLSGHTHGGQLVIPGYGAAPKVLNQIRRNTPRVVSNAIPYLRKCAAVTKNWKWSEGWHQIGRNQLYVNRGLGTYFPGRWNCPPEITVITLEAQ